MTGFPAISIDNGGLTIFHFNCHVLRASPRHKNAKKKYLLSIFSGEVVVFSAELKGSLSSNLMLTF